MLIPVPLIAGKMASVVQGLIKVALMWPSQYHAQSNISPDPYQNIPLNIFVVILMIIVCNIS